MTDYRLTIDGEPVATDDSFPILNPATGAEAGRAPNAGAAELDQDTHLDLVWQDDAAGVVSVWYLNGIVRTSAAAVASVNPVWHIRTVGDYNGDAKPDFIWQHSTSGELYAWFLNGATLASASYLSPGTVNPMWRIVGPR